MRYLVRVCGFLICSISMFAQAAPAQPPAPAAAPAKTPAPAVAPKTPAAPPPPAAAPAPVQAPEPAPVTRTLLEVKKVYMFPMRGGFDQMLANHLTSRKTFEVVTDSKLADAVITDNIGEAFQARMRELYAPKPKPVEKAAKAADKADGDKTA